ncbi:thiamine diphosphokinase [Marivita sp. XM-24bin2]|jgi:thiamine pyrophosphokinase|uniref:thiamine diphosphokinase n=1 Tax=unclassified Marivita TaxID=2632480 RepID=UPI000D78E325|nr:thiamine diphosphokinase [Marivita sp. XM-24bin2]MCR9107328.1 thiamine diphosphokinase [Paracoccaceae bacterium]PWL36551.1 MAG: thiamine diphosphokinase [Marivita sp. XM-24bin2]
MDDPIVLSQEPVLLVGGAHGDNAQLLAVLVEAGTVVAADSGADWIASTGRLPDVLIGDLDSVSDATRGAMPPTAVHQIAEQDSTDLDKAIRSISAPLILGIGFLGGQVDHLLAAMTVLSRYPDRAIMLIGDHDVVAHVPPRLDLWLEVGTRVSLFPMRLVRGRSTGLHWPIDGLDLSPYDRVGTSNRADGPVSIQAEEPGLLIILPVSERNVLQQALLQASDRWPAL